MGPQVGYYSPQIFSEYELHGGGIDISGVTFPGASPYPLIGHGIDFAWSGTSANGDNQDTFVEKLCNPDGSAPTDKSTHYVYKGECITFMMRDQTLTTPFSPSRLTSRRQTITYRTMRSVHGPVFAFATVAGAPVALTKAKGVDFHELEAVFPFMRLAENQPTDARVVPAGVLDLPGHGELVLRRRPHDRVPAVRPLPAPRARVRRRPAVLGRRARRTGSASTRRRTRSSRSPTATGRGRSTRSTA